MRKELEAIVAALLEASEASGEVSLDAIGEAVGARAVSQDDVDSIMHALEAKGRLIKGPEGGGGEKRLAQVIATARSLAAELGRKPSVAEIAARAGLSAEEVRHALALAQIMQR